MNKKSLCPSGAKEHLEKRSKEEILAIRQLAAKKAQKWRRIIGLKHMLIGALAFALITGIISYSGILADADHLLSDALYQAIANKKGNSHIRIISVDEKTIRKYGQFEDWPRDITAAFLNQLNRLEDKSPSVIGFDLDYSRPKDSEGDNALIDACSSYKNVCFGVYAVMEDLPATPVRNSQASSPGIPAGSGANMMGGRQVTDVRMPFDGLLEQVTIGIVNNTIDSDDGIVRDAFSHVRLDGVNVDSFSTAVYKMYMDDRGVEYVLPKLDEDQSFHFTFSKKSHEYAVYSFADVLEGKIPPGAFQNCIVLVGSLDDDTTFFTPNQRDIQMQELELQANILEAMLEQRTGQEASKSFTAVFFAVFAAIFFIATSYSALTFTPIIAALVITVQLLACWLVNLSGYYVNILVPLIMIVLISIYNLIFRYAIALQNQYAIENTFKKYVDERVVSELEKDGRMKAQIGVVSKDIAVLFVDIRGFTSLSESLPPEQIVKILNAYLGLVAQTVAKYQGTLDKFIGDAAMAVFNSPSDLEDYEFKAVCAALDLRANASGLNEMCEQEYGKQVTFGIGIQCGEAVIGNIGCEKRMDYTAIGDTVNTASRLEGSAAPGQILISAEMMHRLQGRIKARFAGEYILKGKKNAVPTYAVENITDTAQQGETNKNE